MYYVAHVCEDGRIQSVDSHLREVAEIAAKDGEKNSIRNITTLAAILHDMGKNTKTSNEYQHTVGTGGKWNKPVVVHSNAGGKYIYETFIKNNSFQHRTDLINCYLSEIIAIAIMSHHGLFDCLSPTSNNKIWGFYTKIGNSDYDYNECVNLTLKQTISEAEIKIFIYQQAKNLMIYLNK